MAALSGTQAVSQQDVDVKTADAAEQKAQVAAAQQDVARYQALIAFKQLKAPFDGVVTARRTNIGDYVNAAGGDATIRSASAPLFEVADIHAMRIFVSVPQEYADVLKPGLTATLTLPQDPDKPIPAQVLTTANSVSTATRTVVTELTVDNANRELWPGTYVSVHFTFPSDPNILIVPEQALLFRAQGMQVAVLDDQDRVHLQNVVLGHNLDTEVQIVSGLKPTDKFVGNPSLGLLEGQQVKIVQPVPGYQPGRGNTPAHRCRNPLRGRYTGASPARAAQPTAAREPSEAGASTATGTDPARGPRRGRSRAPDLAVMGFTSGPRRARRRCGRALAAPIVAAQISVCGCDLAPKYQPPQYVLPANYQGSKPFKVAHPLDTMQRGPWWERFSDPLLNQLERQLTAENPDLAALAEQYTQARDLAAEARSGLFPQVTASGLVSENKELQYRLFHNPHSTFQPEEASNVIQATASWEPDFWSQIRNKTQVQKQLAQASAATLAAARLSLQAELANDYIALRGLTARRRSIAHRSRITRRRSGSPRSGCRAASPLLSTLHAPKASWPRRRRCRAAFLATAPFSSMRLPSWSAPIRAASRSLWRTVATGPAGRSGGRASGCCSAGRISPVPSGRWLLRTPRSVFRAPPSTPISPSARLAASRTTASTSSACRTACGRSVPAPCCPCSRAACAGPRCSGAGPNTRRRATTTVRRYCLRFRKWRTAWR